MTIPKDYGSLTTYAIVRSVRQFIDFLKQAFDAVERGEPVANEDGTIGHAEVWIGDTVLQMFDGKPYWPATPAFFTLYVEDCDVTHQRALDAGAVEITPLSNNAWGDRGSRIRDPFGNIWWIQTHVEDVDEAEMMRRMGEPEYIAGMQIAQDTLDREMSSRI